MQEVCLLGLEQAGVVVSLNSGVVYWSLVGQPAQRREQEGLFVPVSNDPMEDYPELALLPRLQQLIVSGPGLSLADAAHIDALLLEVSSSDQFQVDRSRLQDSQPGWSYITMNSQGDFSYVPNAGRAAAVLVWPLKPVL